MDSYPDAVKGVRDVLDELDGTTYYHLTADFASRPLPAYLIYATGGTENYIVREDRITVQAYAVGRTKAHDAAEAARAALDDWPHDTSEGLLDRVLTDTVPVEVPQHEGQPALFTATYRVETRSI